MTDITLHRQLRAISVWLGRFVDIQCVLSVQCCLTRAPEFPTLLYCVQSNFRINLDQKSRKFHQLKNTMNSVAEQKWSVGLPCPV